MTFLQPLLLFALPLIALPILIHLINQNRHRTMPWAATMFLLQAKRMARGMARLRYLLIMLARMLAIAGLIFAISRPMAGGWLGLSIGGAPDTTIVILDRSVSMEEQDPQTGRTKRWTALQKLSDLVDSLSENTKLVLFDSATGLPLDIESAQDLNDLPETLPTSTSSDIPALMQSVTDYIVANETGRTNVWVCSDLRQNDWDPAGGRWQSIREQLASRDGIRFYLLSYPDIAPNNLAVSVSGVHRRETLQGAELVMDIRVTRSVPSDEPQQVALSFVIDGARSRLDVEVTGRQLVRNGHAIPIDRESKRGWGRVELPSDANMADNVYRFVYAEPSVQKSVIVSDNTSAAKMLRAAAATAADPTLVYEATVLPSARAVEIAWEDTALVIWQAPLPTGLLARQLTDHVLSGRTALFFPPHENVTDGVTGAEMFETHWTEWTGKENGSVSEIARWRTDSDLLANTQNGAPLPVGDLQSERFCMLASNGANVLAQFSGAHPLLLRAYSDQGAAYFCTTLPVSGYSNLVDNGVVFYVMIQRALARGASAMGAARQLECRGGAPVSAEDWRPLDDESASIRLSRRWMTSGVYETDDAVAALNRPLSEDGELIVSDSTLQQVMSGLDYTRVYDQVGSSMALASEIWRAFLLLMIIALLAEALLCMPERTHPLKDGVDRVIS